MGLVFKTYLSRLEDLTLFTRHIAGAMEARVPLPDVLRAFVADNEDCALTLAAAKMVESVELGTPLSVAMENHPAVFPAAYRRTVKLGEQSRSLGGMMSRLADNIEEALRMQEYLRRAGAYPLFLLLLLSGVCSFIATIIVPKMQDIMAQMGQDAHTGAFTQGAQQWLFTGQVAQIAILALSVLMLIPIGYLLTVVFGIRFKYSGYGRFSLSLPFFGPVLRRFETARFASNLSLLLRNGIPMTEALGLLQDSSDNRYVCDAIADLKVRYEQGEKLGDLFSRQPLFPASMAVMIGSAEDKGALVDTLDTLAAFYTERAKNGLTVMRELLEPFLVFAIGIILALIIVSVYIPIFSIPNMMSVGN